MIIIMDMESGRYRGDDFGVFEEEVLNAQWLPQQSCLQPQLALQLVQHEMRPVDSARSSRAVDAEAFLRSVYLNQD